MIESLQNEVCVAVAAAQDHTVFLTETYDVSLFTAVWLVQTMKTVIIKHITWDTTKIWRKWITQLRVASQARDYYDLWVLWAAQIFHSCMAFVTWNTPLITLISVIISWDKSQCSQLTAAPCGLRGRSRCLTHGNLCRSLCALVCEIHLQPHCALRRITDNLVKSSNSTCG